MTISTDMDKLLTAVVTILLGIVGVAFLTALVSNQSETPSVIGAFSGGFACTLRTAITGKNECDAVGVGTGKFCYDDPLTKKRVCQG